jgi:small subunit ribosomal protein S17
MDKQTKKGKQAIRTVEGVVKSVKMNKTVIVSVTTMFRHPLYMKAVKRTKRFAVHCEGISVAVGDTVRILETKPISKTKHYKVLEIIAK